MKPVEAFILLMCAVVGLVLLGRRLKIPYPIALVIGGLGISLIPGLPPVHLRPDLVFLLVLPPLLYAAAWITSLYDFKANLRPILFLAVGLVLFTTLMVGWVVHALIPGIPLAVAFALGAIVSPPDAVAATAIARRLGLPKRIVTVLEGESLVNDATGLIALRFAIAAAAVSGSFSLGTAALQFVWMAIGGVALGLLVGILLTKAGQWVQDESLFITVTLLGPYIAALTAERLHVSSVLSAVAAGLYGGWTAPELINATTRLRARAVWEMWIFLLNCVVFILIGLELSEVRRHLGHRSLVELAWYGAVTSAVVILVRPIWVYPAAWLPRRLSKRLAARDPIPPWRHLLIVSWCGMRGVVSLAAALALPITLPNGEPFPERGLILFLTFCVILATLVLQGLTLPLLIRGLGVSEQNDFEPERRARLQIAQAALAHLNQLAERESVHSTALQHVTERYHDRIRALNDHLAETLGWSADHHRLVATRRLWRAALHAERRELIRLRRQAQLDEELMHRIEHEIDLEETRLQS